MKKSEKEKKNSSLVWSTLVLGAGCIGYVFSKQWLFLMGGIIGFSLITTLKE